VVASFRGTLRCAVKASVPAVLTNHSIVTDEIMEPGSHDGFALPNDVLIVEDDPMIALDFEDMILGFGVTTVRTAGNVARALDMIDERAPDFALLDVGLIREMSFAIAERLDALKIPYIFVTGYGADASVPKAFADKPRLPKPCSSEALQIALQRLTGDRNKP
jgi:CheY-like chemotaxis protein